MSYKCVRTLRTPSSERFLIQSHAAKDAAVVDVHYPADGSVAGTLIVLDHGLLTEPKIAELLEFIDETLLPMASLDERNLSFTVVKGELFGQFENEK